MPDKMFDKKIQLKGVVFEVTTKCNLHCKYCYNIHKAPLNIPASVGGYRQAKKTLKKIMKLADIERVTMTGGEPFLQERFLELVLLCRMKGKRVVVISNGSGGDMKAYRSLIDMGVMLFELPLHASTAGPHDVMTGVEGSHARSLKSISQLRKLGALVVPMIVVTKINQAHVSGTLRLFSELGLKRIMINRFNIGGAGIKNANDLSLSVDELKQVFGSTNEAAAKYGLNISSNVCSPVCILDGRDYPNIRFSRCSPNVENRPLTLDIEGNVRFCNHSPINMGNIFKTPLLDILQSDYTKSWRHKPTFCTDCDKWERCYGGCRAASEQMGMSLMQVDPILQ